MDKKQHKTSSVIKNVNPQNQDQLVSVLGAHETGKIPDERYLTLADAMLDQPTGYSTLFRNTKYRDQSPGGNGKQKLNESRTFAGFWND